jgi:hypothetical protein
MCPSTVKHIKKSETLVTSRLNFSDYYFIFKKTHYEMKCLTGFLYSAYCSFVRPTSLN